MLYFVTTADSASLVTDSMASNGIDVTPVIQRIFWAFSIGATATALLVAGGTTALQALQAVSIVIGLPFTFIILFMFKSMWTAIKTVTMEIRPDDKDFHTDLLDLTSTCKKTLQLMLAVVAPWVFVGKTKAMLSGSEENRKLWLHLSIGALLFYVSVMLGIAEVKVVNLGYVGLSIYFMFAAYVSNVRRKVREVYRIHNYTMVDDLFSSLLLYPCTVVQMFMQVSHEDLNKKEDLLLKPTLNTALASVENGEIQSNA